MTLSAVVLRHLVVLSITKRDKVGAQLSQK